MSVNYEEEKKKVKKKIEKLIERDENNAKRRQICAIIDVYFTAYFIHFFYSNEFVFKLIKINYLNI